MSMQLPSIELTDDTGLSDGQSLLLHHFVQNGSSRVAHLVKLVDATDAVVGQDQSTGLKHELPRLRVLGNVSGQTDS